MMLELFHYSAYIDKDFDSFFGTPFEQRKKFTYCGEQNERFSTIDAEFDVVVEAFKSISALRIP